MPNETVAFLGLGAMGRRMATRLIDAGHTVVVYNRSPEPAQALAEQGASVAQTPAEAAESATIVWSMLRDDEASRSVWADPQTGALSTLRPDAVAIESSTLTQSWTVELGEAAGARGAHFLDAPVVGTRPHAEGGALTFLVGGRGETLSRVRTLMDALGSVIHHVGAVGTGAAMKLAVNASFAAQTAVTGELLVALEAAGVPIDRSVDVLAALPVTSPVAARVGAGMSARAFAPNFPIELVRKDLDYAVDMASAGQRTTPVVEAARDAYARAVERGLGDDDIVGIIQLNESTPS